MDAVAALYGFCPMENCAPLSLKGCWALLVLPLKYLPRRRRKKKATQVRSLMAIFLGVVPWEAVSKAWITLIGSGRTLVDRESSF